MGGYLFFCAFSALIYMTSAIDTTLQPKISSRSGELIFSVPKHRNISFQTSGVGCVRINGVDLTKSAKLARNVSELIVRYRDSFDESFGRIDELDQLVNGPQGLLRRVRNLETGGGNTSRPGRPYRPRPRNMANLTRSVRALERRIDEITRLLELNECTSNPCDHGALCIDKYNGFTCQCTDGWQGEKCQEDVNECTTLVGTDLGCQNGGTCMNRPGTYECMCPHGWFGIHCTRRSNDCGTSGTDLCGVHGVCVPQNNELGYKCICDQGWAPDSTGQRCVDVDECASNVPVCSMDPKVECRNTLGSFTCGMCPQGFSGNGFHCTDINECEFNNGYCSINPKAQCINTHGSRVCGPCPVGYSGDGVTCVYTGDACAYNNGGCHPIARCTANPSISSSYVSCACPPGYIGSGMGPVGCQSTGVTPQACLGNPCRNGGTCVTAFNVTSGYMCACPYPFSGTNCESQANTCQPNPCQNGGTCLQTGITSVMCICPATHTGQYCDNPRQSCGGRFNVPEGTIKYPLENSIVDRTRPYSCPWIIETNVSKVLTIHFKEFNLEDSKNCVHDWIEFHDGHHTGERSLGRFCGQTTPADLTTTDNAVYIWFRSDHANDNSKFELTWNTTDPVCGGYLSNSQGKIESPGYPNKYPNNRDCRWRLESDSHRMRYQFNIFFLDIGTNSDCSKDYIEFQEGDGTTFLKLCNSSEPPSQIYSSGSSATVSFHSDGADQYQGFMITYAQVPGTPGCGGVFTARQGQISSPSFNNEYQHNLYCEYVIRVASHNRIKLTFQKFDLESASDCMYDSLKIYQGPTTESPLTGTYCGRRDIAPYTFSTNEILIVFSTDSSNTGEGFSISYETVCGGLFRELEGVIESPGYPSAENSYETYDCIYEIVLPLGKAIKLNFLDFNRAVYAYEFSDCDYDDYIEIRDGSNENSHLISKECHKAPPETISSHNYLWIKYHATGNLEGFRANYTSVDTGCGGVLKDDNGVITPPSDGSTYAQSAFCEWIIDAPLGKAVVIHFSQFDLEGDVTACDYDYVRIFENNTEHNSSGKIGEFCGTRTPADITTSSHVVTVIFRSDDSIAEAGFTLEYHFVTSSNCGGNIWSNAGVIKSPNYPEVYAADTDCTWTIHADVNHRILLNISDFSLERINDICDYDYLEIRNGPSSESPVAARLCGELNQIPKRLSSHTNVVRIRFKTDATANMKGFVVTWDSTVSGCGGTITGAVGTVTSPNYPQPYPRNTECSYKISVNPGSVISARFNDMEFEDSETCSLDFVEMFDGPDALHNSLGKFCKMNDSNFRTSGSNMFLRFYSDISYQYKGFKLDYNADCNTVIRGFNGIIESPNHPHTYPTNQDCTWDIIVPSGNKVNITFLRFDLEYYVPYYDYGDGPSESITCEYDYLEVKYVNSYTVKDRQPEGSYVTQGKYCGDKVPPPITLNANNVRLHFITDSSAQMQGFRLEWQLFGCGGKLTLPTGDIKSPNFPKAYLPSVTCEWLIQAEYGSSIELQFGTLDLETTKNCTADSVKIYNGPDQNYTLIANLCHQNNATTVTSTGNYMYVVFASDSRNQARGFSANYTIKPTKCGGKFTSPQGWITSPNYPRNYEPGDTCDWLVQLDEGHTIQFEFEDLDMVKQYNDLCQMDYITVFDGPSTSYKEITRVCEDMKPNATYVSTNNQVLIQLRTHDYLTAKGFKLHYYQSCGGNIVTDGSGQISYTSTTQYSLKNDTCKWTIKTNVSDGHVYLGIGHVEESGTCHISEGVFPVTIYSGESTGAPKMGEYCLDGTSHGIPDKIMSAGPALTVVINPKIDFFATYTIFETECGGTLSSLRQSFASPGYPDVYPSNTQCEWTLAVAEGNHAHITFSAFSLLDSPNCNTDFLEVRSDNSSGKVLGVFCGINTPTNITDVGSIYILLKTTSPAQGDISTAIGFRASYNLVLHNELNGTSGRIESPLYPRKYRGTDRYTYRVTVDFGKKIAVNFLDFDLGYGQEDSASECALQELIIYDGFDAAGEQLYKLCGFVAPENFTTSSNIMFITMWNSGTYRGSKFQLEWLQVAGNASKSGSAKNSSCGSSEPIEISTLHNFTLQSPGYPNGYATDLVCEWIFTTSSMNHLEIYFKKVDLIAGNGRYMLYNYVNCYNDFVEIFRGVDGTQNWQSQAKVCAPNATYSITDVKSNMMKVKFTSNSYENGTGFDAKVYEECGGNLRERSGMIIMDNTTSHMSTYSCQWNVTVRPGRKINITFPLFDIGAKSSDCENYILLRNGEYEDSPFLSSGKFCGQTPPTDLQTTSNYLYVEYIGGYQIKGFHLKYQEVSHTCGGDIELDAFFNSTEITSPNYPNIPQSHTECIWTISAPSGEAIRIDFEDSFDIRSDDTCSLEYVELRDGGTRSSQIIGKFCGKAPDSQHTNGNLAHITYFTDLDNPENGFKAKISIASCGGTLRSPSGVIQSPYYGRRAMYPTNMNCTWHLQGPKGYAYQIKFDELDIPYSSNCSEHDRVTIFQMKTNYLEKVTDVCKDYGETSPREIKVTTNNVFIQFFSSSDVYRAYKGFKLNFSSWEEDCDEDVEASDGTLSSPGYPNLGIEPVSCTWNIKVPKGRRVILELEDLDLGLSVESWESYFHIYNDKDYEASLKRIEDVTNYEHVIKSTDNIMTITYGSSGGSSLRGVKAKFRSDEPTVCSGSFNDRSGTLSNPANETSYYCSWKRSESDIWDMNSSQRTLAMSLDFSVVNSSVYMCEYEQYYLSISAGDEDDQTVRGFCSNGKYSDIVRTPFPQTTVKAIGSFYDNRVNFSLSYRSYLCGGVLNKENGAFSSPDYPSASSSSMECSWLLQLPSEQTVKLTFGDFQLDNDCDKNYLVIYNGQYPTAPKIGKFCNNNKPTVIQSQSNYLWVDYHVGDGVTAKGFTANFEPVIFGCGGTFHDSSRTIQTPQYPKDYPSNAECVWEINAPEGYHISFQFFDRFHLEQSDDCASDYVEISEGQNDNWKSIAKKCGRDLPAEFFNSTSNHMKVIFRSNDNNGATGFKARWTFVCGGKFEVDRVKKYVSSPGYPKAYGINMECVYNFTTKEGDSAWDLVFEEFELEGDMPHCMFDSLEVKQVTPEYYFGQSPVLMQYCGDEKPPSHRLKAGAIVKFKSDSSLGARGFRFWYKTEACGGKITEPSTLASPDIGARAVQINYDGGRDCEWKIEAPEANQIIVFKFEKISMAWQPPCTYTGIKIYEGDAENQNNLTVSYCGKYKEDLPIVLTKTNKAVLVAKGSFYDKTDSFAVDVLFTYGPSAGCGGDIVVDGEKTIQAPDLADIDCLWTLTATPGNTIKIKFTQLNLKTECFTGKNYSVTDCPCSYIELRDGLQFTGPLMTRVCSNTSSAILQQEFVTSDRHALLRISSLGQNHNAFTATVSVETSVCGTSLLQVTKDVKVLTSPLYPSSYPANRICRWTFSAPEYNDLIDLHFIEFELNEENGAHITNNKCTKDKIIVYDVPQDRYAYSTSFVQTVNAGATSFRDHEFCGKDEKPFDFYSTRNEMKLTFVSTSDGTKGKGFKLEYRLAGCNRNYTSPQERIIVNKMTSDCNIYIEGPEGKTISLYFNTFNIYSVNSANCSNAGVQIFENSASGKSLMRSCGYATPNPVFSTTNKLYIHLWGVSGNYYSSGLDVGYTSTDGGPGCGGSFYNTNGKFSSPMYPFDYRNDTTCTWEIRVPVNGNMALTFTVFDIQGACDVNYVIVKTYEHDIASEHKFCKTDNPATLISNSKMTVIYRASRNNGGTGWMAEYKVSTDNPTNVFAPGHPRVIIN